MLILQVMETVKPNVVSEMTMFGHKKSIDFETARVCNIGLDFNDGYSPRTCFYGQFQHQN